MDAFVRLSLANQDQSREGQVDADEAGGPAAGLRPLEGSDRFVDLRVRVEESHTVGDVAMALQSFASAPDGDEDSCGEVGLFSQREGPLDPDLPAVSSLVTNGDVLSLMEPPGEDPVRDPARGRSASHKPTFELVVESADNDNLGLWVALREDSTTVGRDEENDFCLPFDPSISREVGRLVVSQARQVSVEVSEHCSCRVAVDGEVIGRGRKRALSLGSSLDIANNTLRLRQPIPRASEHEQGFGETPFNRTPNFQDIPKRFTLGPIAVPKRPEPTKFIFATAAAPILSAVMLAVLFDRQRYLWFAALSPLVLALNVLERHIGANGVYRDAKAKFADELGELMRAGSQRLQQERALRRQADPAIAELMDTIEEHAPEVWRRDRHHPDFGNLRLGIGQIASMVEALSESGGEHTLAEEFRERTRELASVDDVPIRLNAVSEGVVAFVGNQREVNGTTRSALLQAAALHSPEDLIVVAAVAEARQICDWVKWLPHSRSQSSPVDHPGIATDRQGADKLVGALVEEGLRRVEAKDVDLRFPWILAVLDQGLGPGSPGVSQLLDLCPAAGISVVWLGETINQVPRQASAVIFCRPSGDRDAALSHISHTDVDRPDQTLRLDTTPARYADGVARSLAPYRDASARHGAASIPSRVTLFSALGIEAVEPQTILNFWHESGGRYQLPVPVGMRGSSDRLELDLVRDGPHGLIGGTSGSGKSELLMAMVGAAMARNPPDRLNVLFIDYKGGASSEPFRHAPHTVGLVGNLNVLKVNRVLVSLRAELNRRMRVLNDHKAKDLAELLRLERRARRDDPTVRCAPPSLLIVVDEFATINNSIDGFSDGIVDIAQRGRSLGIHLMLATQRPQGSINDNIRANTNLRVCLRMLDALDSSSVIGTSDAALIPPPLKGRGFVSFGSNELVAFQSAFAGAPLAVEDGVPPVEVQPFYPWVDLEPARDEQLLEDDNDPEKDEDTHLSALLEAIDIAADLAGVDLWEPPWHDDLFPVLSLDDCRAQNQDARTPGAQVLVGMVDNPAGQEQRPAVIDLRASGGLVAYGTGRSGKTNLLKVAAISAALDDLDTYNSELVIYGIDYASRQLSSLRALPQCQAVAAGSDLEAVTRILTLLQTEFDRRRRQHDLPDEQDESEPGSDPSILFLIDGLDSMIQVFESAPERSTTIYLDVLTDILANGRQVGIYPIVTASRKAAIKPTLLASLTDRITFRQAEPQGYHDTGLTSSEAKDLQLLPGQGFLNGPEFLQVAVPIEVATQSRLQELPDFEFNEAVLELINEEEATYLTRFDDEPEMPVADRFRTRALDFPVPVHPSPEPMRPVIGQCDLTNGPYQMDLTYEGVAVCGPPRSGRSTTATVIADQLGQAGRPVYAVADPPSPLCDAAHIEELTFLADMNSVHKLLTRLASGDAGESPVLVCDDGERLLEDVDDDLFVKAISASRLVMVLTRVPSSQTSLYKALRRALQAVVCLRPDTPLEMRNTLDAPTSLWHPGLPMHQGRGFVKNEGEVQLVQVSKPSYVD